MKSLLQYMKTVNCDVAPNCGSVYKKVSMYADDLLLYLTHVLCALLSLLLSHNLEQLLSYKLNLEEYTLSY